MSSFSDTFGGSGGSYDYQGAGKGGDAAQLQQMLMAEQQRAVVQAVIARLTEVAFDKCIGKPDSSLSSKEGDCIKKVTERYLDTSQFVMNRLAKSRGGM